MYTPRLGDTVKVVDGFAKRRVGGTVIAILSPTESDPRTIVIVRWPNGKMIPHSAHNLAMVA